MERREGRNTVCVCVCERGRAHIGTDWFLCLFMLILWLQEVADNLDDFVLPSNVETLQDLYVIGVQETYMDRYRSVVRNMIKRSISLCMCLTCCIEMLARRQVQ